MSKDLDSLMNKLKEGKKPTEKVEAVSEIKEEVVEDIENVPELDPDAEDDDVEDEEDVKAPTPAKKVTPKPTPVKEDEVVPSIDDEVALLQNDGIFRRELLLALKELVDVHKVNTQALLDLVGIARGEDGKK